MKNYKTAKIFIITVAALTCIVVAITFIIGFTKKEAVSPPEVMTSAATAETAHKVVIEYKGESMTFSEAEDVKMLKEKFLSLELKEKGGGFVKEGTITFFSTEGENEEKIEVGFDKKMEMIELDGKFYYSDQLLSFKNLIVTLAFIEDETETTEETTEETSSESDEEETTEKPLNSANYSSKAVSVEWGGTSGYLKVASMCENYDTLVTSHTKHFPIVRIKSVEELNNFTETVKEYFTLDTAKYDSDHFEEKELFIICADENSAKADHVVDRVELKEGKMTVFVTDSKPLTNNAGLESRFIFLSIEKQGIEDIAEFDAYTEY